MKYNCLDFAILRALNNKINTEDEILISASSSFPCPPSFYLFESCMKRLSFGGYITKQGGKIYPTEKCKTLFKGKKLFESKDKFICRLEDEFLSLDEQTDGSASDIEVSLAAYKDAYAQLEGGYAFSADLRLCEGEEENYILLTPPTDTENYLDGEISKNDTLILPLEANSHLPAQLFESASTLTSPSKAKKVCIYDGKAYYVLTMSQEGAKIKISAQKILFNAKRFIGKRDSQLDYAQCADTSVSFYTTDNNLYMSAALLLLEYDCRKG